MTYAPGAPPLPVSDVAAAAAALRRRGGRLSQPRRQVLEALFAAEGPVSAEYLAQGLGGRTMPVELTSAYRALEHLERLGVVRHVHLGHGPGLYALAGTHEREYLVCERCDRVMGVDAARLDPVRRLIQDAFGYHARFSHFPIVGLCASCANHYEPAHSRNRGGAMTDEHTHEHLHAGAHSHEHSHGDLTHSHSHTAHDHEHTEHEHEHSHGDYAHSHPHLHEQGLEDEHSHEH
jgi:Fur family transcriptional regulator, ferric uptake regulator